MRITFFTLLVAFGANLANADQLFVSGERPPQLIELFTSEGCSSCPPADHFLTKLKNEEGLWTDFVPVAFHVDYWDWLGWKDRFASKDFSNRQRNYARQRQADSVYTPGFMVAGEEWRGFFRGQQLPVNSQLVAPKLSLFVIGDEYELKLASGANRVGKTHVAVLGMDLQTPVKRGENAGRTLIHDFVVLDWQTFQAGETEWKGKINLDESVGTDKFAIAAWVENANTRTPLQVVGGYLEQPQP